MTLNEFAEQYLKEHSNTEIWKSSLTVLRINTLRSWRMHPDTPFPEHRTPETNEELKKFHDITAAKFKIKKV